MAWRTQQHEAPTYLHGHQLDARRLRKLLLVRLAEFHATLLHVDRVDVLLGVASAISYHGGRGGDGAAGGRRRGLAGRGPWV